MKEDEINKTYITLGLVCKLPYGDIDKLKLWLSDNNFIHIYSIPTLGRIVLKEILPPSGTTIPVGEDDEEY